MNSVILLTISSTFSITVSTDDTSRSSPTTLSSSLSSSSSTAVCYCENNVSSVLVENAKKMKEQTKNKTMINKIKHRATHSSDALWASICLSVLLVVMVLGMLQTKMWQDSTFLSYPETQPSKYEQFSEVSEIKVKQLIKSQGRKLIKYFSKKSRKKPGVELNSFKMETFMSESRDEVDNTYQRMIESSSDESDESDEDIIFSLNRRTGEWEAGDRGYSETKSARDNLGSYSLVDSSITRDLSRHSESSSEPAESEPLISV